MKLKSIKIQNFKKHKDLEVNFTNGLNTIYGANYTGKSTIQQAIAYAMFGPSVVPGKSADLKTKGEKGPLSVTLDFEIEGVAYSVQRSGSNAKLSKGIEVVSRSASAVVKELESLIGLSKDQFFRTKVSKQGEAQALLAINSQELKKLVEDLSGCSVVDSVLKLSKVKAKTSREVLETLLSTIDESFNSKAFEKLLITDKEQHSALSDEIAKKLIIVEASESRTADVEGDYVEAALQHAKYQTYTKSLAALLAEVERSTKEVESLSVTKASQLNDWAEELRTLEDDIAVDALTRKLYTSAEGTSKRLRVELRKLKESDDLEEPTKIDVGDLEESIYKHAQLQHEQLRQDVQLKTIKKALKSGVCPACERALEGVGEDFIHKHEEDLKNLNYQRDGIQTQLESAEKQLVKLKKQKRAYEGWESLKASLTSQEVVLKTKLEESENNLTSLSKDRQSESDLESLRSNAAKLKKMKTSAEDCNSQYKHFVGNLQKSKSRLESLKEVKDVSVEDFKEVLQTAKDKEVLHKSEYNAWRLELVTLKSKIEASENTLKTYKGVYTRVVSQQNLGQAYTSIGSLISKHRAALMGSVWAGLLKESGDFVRMCTSGDVNSLSLDEKFNLMYEEHGHTLPLDAASGSQKSLIGLGLRVAIANLLPSKVDFLLLDEVSSDMEEAVSALAMSAVRLSSKQALVISHRHQDLTTSDNLIGL